MGVTSIYAEYTGDMAKEAHRKYNSVRYRIDGTRLGDFLNELRVETDPFKEERR